MPISDRLRELRKVRGITQKDVCDGINVSRFVYQRYEYGQDPAFDKFIALADYFDVSLDYLAGRTDNPKVNV